MITFVSHTSKAGGGELALRRYLDTTNLQVRLVTMEPGGVWEGLRCEMVHAHNLIALRQSLRGGDILVPNSMRMAFLTALLAPRKARIVYWVRDGLSDSAMSPLALWLTKHFTARRTTHYIANSQWTARTIRELTGVEPENVDFVYSMCGVRPTDPGQPTRRLGTTGEPLRLLFLGRLSPWKAPDVAVRALAALSELGVDATLTIAGGALFGEDGYASDLATLVAAEPRATIVGHVDDVQGLLNRHDLLVHCSTVPEPFGQVIIQGLAAGMPVVATAAGGPMEILGNSPTRLLYRPGDVNALASTIAAVAKRYGDVSQWAITRSRDFSDQKAASEVDAVLRSLQATPTEGPLRSAN